MNPQKKKTLMNAFKKATVLPSRQLEDLGLFRTDLQSAVIDGLIERVAPGVYRRADADVTEHHSFVEAAERIPSGVICLLSALRFHELTTQAPHQIWIAVPRGNWIPKGPGLRVLQFAAESIRTGVEEHEIEGRVVRVTSVARTVADCFKFRTKVGLDVAIEALREGRRARRCSVDELMAQARVCRVANVIRPYLEALS